MLVTHRPAAPLALHVDTIWYGSRDALPHRRELSLPTGRADIVIPLLQDSVVRFDSVDSREARHLRGAVVSGAHDRCAVRGMGGASSVMGVHFRPGGAAAFFGAALHELGNRTELLDAVWGSVARDLRERLQVADALSQRVQIVDAVQDASNCFPQQFIRRFTAAVGITPKRYARVLRFNALLPRTNRVGPRDWAALAAHGGHFDQSHLIHEFKRMAGLTPTAYAPLDASRPQHVPIADAPRATAAWKNLQYTGR